MDREIQPTTEMLADELRLLTPNLAQYAPADERRSAPRRYVVEPCTVASFNGTEVVRAKGMVQDVSDGGLRVRTSLNVARGSNLKIFLRLGTVIGDVRHCTPNGNGTFDIGVRVETGHGIVRRL